MGFFDDALSYDTEANDSPPDLDRAGATPAAELDTPAGMSDDFSAKTRRPPVPLPPPRPAEFGPSAYSPPDALARPASPLSGILFGGSPNNAQRVMASLGAGLSNVRNSPFPGQTFANAAGPSLSAAQTFDDHAYNQRLAALDRVLRNKQSGRSNASLMLGAGTQAAPFLPRTPEEYASVTAGSYYLHPMTGLVMRKR